VTRRGLASDGARARRAPPRALCDLSRGGRRALPVVPRRADAPVPACVRAVRIAGCVAGAALRGVRGAKARLHVGPRRDRLRPRRACPRPRVEGGGPPRSGARARSPRHRGGSQAGRRLRRSRSRRSGAGLAPWDVPPRRLALELGRRWGMPVSDLLERTRPLPHQRGLSLDERRRNVRGSVVLRGSGVPRTACVVDDVYTSGATVDACASALGRAGARRVNVVTLARAVR
jgi:hypothetical protein